MACIIVEGETDKQFLEFILEQLLDIKKDTFDIEISDGCTQLKESLLKKLTSTYIANGIPLYVIYDMDNKEKKPRQDEIMQLYKDKDIPIIEENIFLLPNDNDYGYLETLLFDCVPHDRKFILDEFDNYVNKIESRKESLYLSLPCHHQKLYAYANVQLNINNDNDKSIKKRCHYAPEKNGLYKFKIDSEFNPVIQELLDFLKKHVK